MRHFGRNVIIAIFLIIASIWAASPPSEKIGLGKDLRGGASLVYSVELGSTESANEIIPQVIDVLKKRIDPNGLFEISIVRQGQDRIEITMPLPSDKVKQLKQDFENELAKLSITSIDDAEFERMMRLPEEQRAAKIDELGQVSDSVRESLEEAAAAFDQAQQFRAQLSVMDVNPDTPEAELDRLAALAAEAEIRYDVARDAALASAISPEEVKRALERSDDEKFIRGNDGEMVPVDSERKRALDRIRSQYPEIEGQLESVIAAFDEYSENRDSLDDTSDLKRLVQASGVLSFRITVDPTGRGGSGITHPDENRLREQLREKGPKQANARDARWFKINKADSWYDSIDAYNRLLENPAAYFYNFGDSGYVVEEYNGDYYMLCWDTRDLRITQGDARWKVSRAYQTADSLGRPAIGFEMDPAGAARMGDLTGSNVGYRMAVLLDDQVYTAPNLNARITNRGIIEGDFSMEEINYIIRVLGAGSLQAKLSPEPLSENIIAPELGQDNLDAGVEAGKLALVIVSVFMLFYYLGYGVVAVLCLAANAALILGALALSRASLTLPGIAGIILTFGMAVDANVLIFERIREELNSGLDLRQAVRLGYEKALSSIVDGNVTNLIVCLVLANVGTQEIRGFAITLGIGVVCTMISALFFSHIILVALVDKLKFRRIAMLPMLIKPLERALQPNINWIGLRWVTVFVSLFFVGLGIVMVVTQGSKMLDTEFRGGTQITLAFKESPDSPDTNITMSRPDVEEIVHQLGENDPVVEPLRNAEVLPINPEDDGLTADTFVIKATATNKDDVADAVINAFRDKIDVPPALRFVGSSIADASAAPTYPVVESRVGDNIKRPEFRNDATEFDGGLAILLENLSPAQSVEDIRRRLAITRQKDDFSDIVGRKVEIIALEGTPQEATTAVILVLDPTLDYFTNQEVWQTEVQQREWDLVIASLANSSDQLSVQSFSPAIAENFRATAVAAVVLSLMLILIYIWVRFGSVRYSAAAIAALTHDVLVVIGLIAFAEIIYEHESFRSFANALMIEPFKIDLNLIAALLTLIGYSLNDTIVIMDRIRENRGKLPYASKAVINRSINETISRTLVTSGTTLLAIFLLYTYGGPGVHAFSYALLVGVLVGTYSSIAVASPLVWSRKRDISERKLREQQELDALPKPE